MLGSDEVLMSSPASYSLTCIFPAKDPRLASKRAPAGVGEEVINAEQLRGLIPAPLPKSFVSFAFYLHKGKQRARLALGIPPCLYK